MYRAVRRAPSSKATRPATRRFSVSLASIAGSSAVAIDYQATVNNPLPFQLARIANQGYVASDNAPAAATDDPATTEAGDATTVMLAMGAIRGVAWIDDGDGSRCTANPRWRSPSITRIPTIAYSNQHQHRCHRRLHLHRLAPGEYRVGFQLREGFRYSAVWGADKDNKVDPARGQLPITLWVSTSSVTNLSSGQVSALESAICPAALPTRSWRTTVRATSLPSGGRRLYLGTAITTSADGLESATASGHGDGVRAAGASWGPAQPARSRSLRQRRRQIVGLV